MGGKELIADEVEILTGIVQDIFDEFTKIVETLQEME